MQHPRPTSNSVITEKVTVSFNHHKPYQYSKMYDPSEIVYPLIQTKIHGHSVNIMLDTGAASSHIIAECVDKWNGKYIKREVGLQVIGFGNTRSKLITHFTPIHLIGRKGEKIAIRFNVLKEDITTELPAISTQILDQFPHLIEHKSDFSASIPRGPQKVHAIIGLRDVGKIYDTIQGSTSCSEVCMMKRADGDGTVLEARNSIFGTILLGCTKDEHNKRVLANDTSSKSNPIEDPIPYTTEDLLVAREIPMDILLKNAIGISDDLNDEKPVDRSALQKRLIKSSMSPYK